MQAEADACAQAARRWTEAMSAGDFEAAWLESNLIDRTGCPDPNRFWTGESWAGKRVMLRCLHGLGDTIQFIRYAPLLKQTCSHLTVQSHPEMVRLLRTVPSIDAAVTWGEGEQWDMQMEVTELPRAFRTILSSIPQSVPYLNVCDEAGVSSRCHVGLIWQSSQWNPARSIPFTELAPLLGTDGCEFHCLQEEAGLKGWDVFETARRMGHMDLVISVDTMCAHLAGALGKQVWIMLPAEADWRWMRGRNDSPWYPTARLFRQKDEADWAGVIETVRQAFCEWKNG